MKISTTTGDFAKICGNDHIAAIKHLYDAGFRYIDLNMGNVEEDDALIIREDWRETVKKIREFAENLGMQFVQAHSPANIYPFQSEEDYDLYVKCTIRSIRVCKELGIPNIVVHPGLTPGMRKDEFYEMNGNFYAQLFPVMEETGVNVLTENASKKDLNGRYQPTTGAEIRHFVEYVNHPLFHICWDFAHANMDGLSPYKEIMDMGEHLYAIHLSDNMGAEHRHVIPFMGVQNMDEVMNGLLDVGYKGYFNFEAAGSLIYADRWPSYKKRFERDNRLADPQLWMEKEMERFKYQVGKYILETYDCFEE